ncbi:unnamed protein product [Allacma fusca]|uniref:Peptidase M14 domain-containing protein n=1 Tax=Allacma fusca TaxID=39272 RepID=A0A8J2LHR4_9HEXA|nr:unnamed protein product [Allacma fusca]
MVMARSLILGLSALCIVSSVWALPTSTPEKLQVIRAFAASPSDVSTIRALEKENIKLDFWKDPRLNDHADIMVDSLNLKKVVSILDKNNISHHTMIEDVNSLIAEQERERQEIAANGAQAAGIDWDNYYQLAEIEGWLDNLSRESSAIEGWLDNLSRESSAVSIQNIGTSYEGRTLKVAKISNGSGNSTNKPAILITATIHAREWIAAATATYIIDQLASNSSAHPDILDLVDFYILPVINPDGYAYTASSRLWRKSRSRGSSSCIGTDGNRNFGYKWGDGDVPGSSGDPCSETYRGSAPFSERETAAVRDYIESNSNVNWTVYVTFHSYGQYFMSPWGYTRTLPTGYQAMYFMSPWGYTRTLPTGYQAMKQLSDVAAAALTAKYGTRYSTGSSANVLYYTDGTDQDWAFGSGHFPFSYTMELRDTGSYGFLLPARLIKPTAEETFEAIKTLARNVPK